MPCGQKIAGVGAEDREGGALALGCGGSSPPASPVPLRYVPGHHPPFRWNEAPGLWTFPRPPVVCVAGASAAKRLPLPATTARTRPPPPGGGSLKRLRSLRDSPPSISSHPAPQISYGQIVPIHRSCSWILCKNIGKSAKVPLPISLVLRMLFAEIIS